MSDTRLIKLQAKRLLDILSSEEYPQALLHESSLLQQLEKSGKLEREVIFNGLLRIDHQHTLKLLYYAVKNNFTEIFIYLALNFDESINDRLAEEEATLEAQADSYFEKFIPLFLYYAYYHRNHPIEKFFSDRFSKDAYVSQALLIAAYYGRLNALENLLEDSANPYFFADEPVMISDSVHVKGNILWAALVGKSKNSFLIHTFISFLNTQKLTISRLFAIHEDGASLLHYLFEFSSMNDVTPDALLSRLSVVEKWFALPSVQPHTDSIVNSPAFIDDHYAHSLYPIHSAIRFCLHYNASKQSSANEEVYGKLIMWLSTQGAALTRAAHPVYGVAGINLAIEGKLISILNHLQQQGIHALSPADKKSSEPPAAIPATSASAATSHFVLDSWRKARALLPTRARVGEQQPLLSTSSSKDIPLHRIGLK